MLHAGISPIYEEVVSRPAVPSMAMRTMWAAMPKPASAAAHPLLQSLPVEGPVRMRSRMAGSAFKPRYYVLRGAAVEIFYFKGGKKKGDIPIRSVAIAVGGWLRNHGD